MSGFSGVGKTATSLEVAKILKQQDKQVEIISLDALQVYNGLDIGTYKVSHEERKIVPHHLLDIYEFNQEINVGEYFDRCMDAIENILQRGNIPLIVGATTYYVEWLLFGKQGCPKIPRDVEQQVYKLFLEDNCWETSFQRLVDVDPEYSKIVQKNDYNRLARALAKNIVFGKALSEYNTQQGKSEKDFQYDFRLFYLTRSRLHLSRLIDYRVEQIINAGFIKEVAMLMSKGMNATHHAAHAIGYRETIDILSSKDPITIPVVKHWIDSLQGSTRRAAKSQLKFAKSRHLRDFCYWVDMDRFDDEFQVTDPAPKAISNIANLIVDNMKLSLEDHQNETYRQFFSMPEYLNNANPKENRKYLPDCHIYRYKKKLVEVIQEFFKYRQMLDKKIPIK